jgi:four helix bundle protein
MSFHENLPIYKKALDLAIYIETIARDFSRYHKYTVGTDLRNSSRKILLLIARANYAKDKQARLLEVRENIEEVKTLIRISKELKVFRSFKSFEYITRLTVDVAKQCEGWLRSQNS